MDEESGKEKRTSQYVLVLATTVKDTFEKVVENMKGMMVDFEISAISESSIMDVFPYFSEDDDIPDNLKPLDKYKEEPGDFIADNASVNDEEIPEIEPDLEEIE